MTLRNVCLSAARLPDEALLKRSLADVLPLALERGPQELNRQLAKVAKGKTGPTDRSKPASPRSGERGWSASPSRRR